MPPNPDRHSSTAEEITEALPPSYIFISGRILRSGHLQRQGDYVRTMQLIGSIEWEGHAAVEVRTSYFGLIVRWTNGPRELELRVSWTADMHRTVQRVDGKSLPNSTIFKPSASTMRGLMKWLEPAFTQRGDETDE